MSAARPPRRVFVAVGLYLLLTAVSVACGFGERREQADHLIGTARRLHDAGTAAVRVTTSFEPKEVTDRTIQTYPFTPPLTGAMDLSKRRVRLDSDRGPAIIFDDSTLYVHDFDEPTAERPWIRLDLDEVEPEDVDEPIVGFNAVSPVAWSELLAGALSGSVERGKTATVNGVELTHYTANVDREKMFTEFLDGMVDDRDLTELGEVFEVIGLRSLVTPAEVWLDGDGLPRKIIFEAEQRVDRHNVFSLTLTYELSDFGTPVQIDVPEEDRTIEVDTIQQLLAETGIEGLARAAQGAQPAP